MAVLKNKSGLQSELIRKNIQKIFKEQRLDIILQCKSSYPNQDYLIYLLAKNYLKKQYSFIKKHCKILVTDKHSPINVLKAITIRPR